MSCMRYTNKVENSYLSKTPIILCLNVRPKIYDHRTLNSYEDVQPVNEEHEEQQAVYYPLWLADGDEAR